MNKGRLQFRHFESIFESREKAYKYIEDIVNESSGEGHRLDESLMAEPIVVVYKDANQKPQAIVCIGVEGEKGKNRLKPYHIIDSAKLEEEIQSMSADIKQEIEKEIETAISNVQSELDATQTGAGLDTGGKYISHSDGNYISGATSIDNATVLLDSALKTESDRATAAENSISGAVNTLSANTVSEVKRIEDKISDNEKVISESINQLKAEIDRTEVGAGLNDDGSYKGHDSQLEGIVYITTANSLDEADVLLDKGIQTETGRATNAEEKLRNSITESATKLSGLSAATENAISNVQTELNTTQTGAGLKEDGTYHKHNTEGDMGNYISNATSIDNATVLLDSALKNEEARATTADQTLQSNINKKIEPFIINLSGDGSAENPYTVDKTREEVAAALAANSLILLKGEASDFPGYFEIYTLNWATNYPTQALMLQFGNIDEASLIYTTMVLVFSYQEGVGLNVMASSTKLATDEQVKAKQDKLISGTNIKTINGESILGSGDLVVGASTMKAGQEPNSVYLEYEGLGGNNEPIFIDNYGTALTRGQICRLLADKSANQVVLINTAASDEVPREQTSTAKFLQVEEDAFIIGFVGANADGQIFDILYKWDATEAKVLRAELLYNPTA